MDDIEIRPTVAADIPSLRATLDQVARERRHIAMLEAPSTDDVTTFVTWLASGAGLQYVAVDHGGVVVGWCDIIRNPRDGFRHCGQLGMGVAAPFRRRGVGRRLVGAALARAALAGITRVELEVFASNKGAVALYRGVGFTHEGSKRGARLLDGESDDVEIMAIHLTDRATDA
jgi:ribosomal protein S18 acetylase RimI-like enzyme